MGDIIYIYCKDIIILFFLFYKFEVVKFVETNNQSIGQPMTAHLNVHSWL